MLFYYSNCNLYQKNIYSILEKAIADFKHRIFLDNLYPSRDELRNIFLWILLDHPAYFWTKGDFMMLQNEDINGTLIEITYFLAPQEKERIYQTIQQGQETCLNYIRNCNPQNDIDVLLQLANWFYNNIKYEQMADIDQSLMSVFCMKKGVCMGISKAASLILKKFGIDSIVTFGTLLENNPHSWLIIKVSGVYYHYDITIGYPEFDNLLDSLYITKNRYAIKENDDWMNIAHKLDIRYSYPPCGGKP